MKHLVEFPLEDGSSIVIEIDEPGILISTVGQWRLLFAMGC
jgi:hypothetical protein